MKKHRILIVDDNEKIHQDFRDILTGKSDSSNDALSESKAALFGEAAPVEGGMSFDLDFAHQGQEGLQKLRESLARKEPYMLAFVDMRMPPGWDGIETIEHLWQASPGLQVVICTAYSDYSWAETIRRLGQTDRLLILKKPFDPIEVRQMACSLTEKWRLLHELDELVTQRTEQIAQTRDIAVFALANLAESRDPETGEHLLRLRRYCGILAEELRREGPYRDQIDDSFQKNLYRSSPLHDIGKVGIPDKILLKPGSLTAEEFDIMKQHTVIGAEALERTIDTAQSAGFLKMAADIARYHHERFDGNGYAEGLRGEEIPLAARIVALTDVFDALTNVRVYKPAFQPAVARLMIEEEKGHQFDPHIVQAFLNRYEEFLSAFQRNGKPSSIAVPLEEKEALVCGAQA